MFHNKYSLSLLVFVTAVCLLLPTLTNAAPKHIPPPEIVAFKPYVGTWSGTLQYSDYETKKLVSLPTTLHLRISTDGYYLISDYGYQDPGVIIEELDLSTIDPVTHKLVTNTFSRGKSNMEADVITGLSDLLDKGQGQLTYTRLSHDDNTPVEIRETDTYTPSTLTFLTEGRHKPSEPFVFRDKITLTRQIDSPKS